jgi:CHAT domain-containing protein
MSSPAPTFESDFVEQLLTLPSTAEQLAHIQNAGLADVEGLSGLLEETAVLVRSNPRLARRLLTIYSDAADLADIPEVIPRAAYLKAQTHALAGEFDEALALIHVARAGHLALGQKTAALRTTAGLMNVLGESGRYQDALEAGQAVLNKIGQVEKPELLDLLAVIQKNMGLCYNLLGRYQDALNAYNVSERLYIELGMTAEVGDISNNRGILLWEMGRGTEALAALEKALHIRTANSQTMLQAQTLSNIGSVYLLLGDFTASLDSFEKARRLFASQDALLDQHVLLLDTANAYLTLNLYEEAMIAYEEAGRLLSMAGVVHQEARAYWGLGATFLAIGQAAEAERVLGEAAASLEQALEEPTPLLAAITLEQAAAQAAGNKISLAERTAQQALALVQGKNWAIPTIYAHLQLADLIQVEPEREEQHLTAAQKLLASMTLPHLTYRLHQRLGRLRRRQGRWEEARLLLEKAAAEIERLRGTLAQEMLRTSFLHDKSAAYDELMRLYLSSDDPGSVQEAFYVAERAKSRTLLDLITGVIQTDGQNSAVEQQADLNAIYNELLNPGSEGMAAERHGALQARAVELERAIVQSQLRRTDSGSLPDKIAAPLTTGAIQRQLPADTTLLVYHILEGEILAFVVTGSELRLFRSLAQEGNILSLLRRLESMLDRLRAGVFSADQVPFLELSTRRVLEMLHQSLVAPLVHFLTEPGLVTSNNPQKVTVVPHGCLHRLPFHALHDGEGYLIEKYEFSYAPSATIYCLCQSRPQPSLENGLIVGVPDPSIPKVTAEIEAVAARLTGSLLLHDEAANRDNFFAAVPGRGLLHMACHGLFRADNPMFSALKLHDGWLTAGEAMKLRLRDAIVTLSACESGRSMVAGGDELLGLLRAFLGAGAATIVVSLWLAQDFVTANLMVEWYDRMHKTGAAPASALREAQLAIKTEYSHPYFWAPFVAVGRR